MKNLLKLFKFSIGEPVYCVSCMQYDEPLPFKGIVKSKLIRINKPSKASREKLITISYLVDMEISPYHTRQEIVDQYDLVNRETASKFFPKECLDVTTF
jgi:hypothetical protein